MINNNELSMSKLKIKASEIISDALVQQADVGVQNCALFFISEPKIPVELLLEKDTE